MTLFKCLWLMLISICLVFINDAYASTCGSGEVTTFDYPLTDWYETCGFDVMCAHEHHMGIDGEPSIRTTIGASVVAPCSGVVKEARLSNGYGGIVIMECQADDECVTPFMAHMYSSTLQVSPGQSIAKGTVIGYIADSANNGGWGPHVHFGIRKGSYDSFNYTDCYSKPVWSYAGYPYSCYGDMLPDMESPTDFIESHQIPTSAYSAITAKADELWGAGLIATEIDDMHWYGGSTATNTTFIIEDWDGGSWGLTEEEDPNNETWVVITYNDTYDSAYVIRHGFWQIYRNHGGPNMFGAPLGDEMDITRTEYTPRDSYWNTNKTGAITNNCGSTSQFTSVQRFEHATFCWYQPDWRPCLSSPYDSGRIANTLPFCYELTTAALHKPAPGEPSVIPIEQLDQDNDGYTIADGDCNDASNGVYPGHPEIPDGVDNDCDGVIDHATNSWLDADSILDDQYLFIDVNQDGFHDPCVRQGTTLYCDQDLNGQHDWVIEYGSSGAEYFSNGTGVTVRWSNNPNWYNDTDSDSITNSVISYGNGLNETQRLVHNGTVMVRWGDQIYLDDNLDGITNRVYTWPNTGAYPLHLADLNGDGVTDLICQVGNILYVNDDMDNATDWWFTYGYADGSDRYYFADMNGDGRDDILVQRCLVDCNWFLVLDNASIQTGGIGNNHDWDFTYGHGLSHPINEQDQDGDGYTPNQGDCNDLSTGVHPGHSEIPDGVDNDCDGLIDEGIVVTSEHQYLFYDANRDGVDDACVYRYEDLILCDTNLDGYHDVSFHYGNSGAEYFAGGHTLCARFGAWFYCDQTADGISEVGFQIGNGGNDDYQFGYNAAAVRYGGTTYVDSDLNGWTNFGIVWGGTTGWPYYLADMDGDGVVDMIRRSGNTYYVNTNRDSYTNWWFTYGSASDDVYFADMDGDGRADPMVRRCATVCNRFLVKFNTNLQLNGAPNYHDMEFTYGWGLP